MLKEVQRRKKSTDINESCDAAVLEIFTKDVFPEITEEYKATTVSLHTKQQHVELKHQLRESLITTMKIILRNHREEHCLKSSSISVLTHAYPLLLREVARWHKTAVKKMKHKKFKPTCWRESGVSSCINKVSFSLDFAPSLWNPLTFLLKEFGAVCKPDFDPGLEKVYSNTTLGSCKEEFRPITLPEYCQFTNRSSTFAFFLHVNNTQQYLEPGMQLLRKPVGSAKAAHGVVKGFLKPLISRARRFHIAYDSKNETIKLSYRYSPVVNCTGKVLCKNNQCNQTLTGTLASWVNVTQKFKSPGRHCHLWPRPHTHIDLTPTRRSKSHGDEVENTIPRPPCRCRAIRKKASKPTDEVWARMVRAAEDLGAKKFVWEVPERIEFYSKTNLLRFFRTGLCSGTLVNVDNVSSSQVRVAVSKIMPYVIERKPKWKFVRLKYYVVREVHDHYKRESCWAST